MKRLLILALGCLFLSAWAEADMIGGTFPPGSSTSISTAVAPGSTNYIQNSSTLQSGAVFNVSSGTVNNFTVQQATVTTSLAMNAKKILNLANGSVSSDAAAYGQLQYLQVAVSSSTSAAFSTTSNTFQASFLGASITPTSASSRIKVTMSGTCSNANAALTNCDYSLFRDATDLGGASSGGTFTVGSTFRGPCGFVHIDNPSTTSAISYTVRVRSDDNLTACVLGANNGGAQRTIQSLVIEEIR